MTESPEVESRPGSRRGLLRAAVTVGAATAGLAACSSQSSGAGAPPVRTSGGPTGSGTTGPTLPGSTSAATGPVSSTASPVPQPSPGALRLVRPQDGADAADRDESAALTGRTQQQAPQPLEYRAAAASTAPAAPAAGTGTAAASSAATTAGKASSTAQAAARTVATAASATAATSSAAASASPIPSTPVSSTPAPASATLTTAAPATGAQPQARDQAASAAAARAVQKATVFGAAGKLSDAQAKEHLLRRATFGPRPSDRADLNRVGIDAWLEGQLTQVPDPMGDAIAGQFNREGTSISQVLGAIPRYSWDRQVEVAQMVLGRWIFSSRQLYEIVVDVFANLLNCTTPSESLWACGPDYHHQVIRKHAYGKYRDMLLAALRHPAMLTYLNNDQSTREHVNEDLGRELLELHTVGVTGGYTEQDVVNSARILSGRGVDHTPQTFQYKPDRHYVGQVTVMGFTDPNTAADQGLDMGDRYLTYLATLPATAKTVARKLAVRFVCDQPPQELVDRLAKTYLDSDTAIVPVLRALFAADEFWAAVGQKTRRPVEDLVASARALDIPLPDPAAARKAVISLYWRSWDAGNAPLGWTPPDGYPDVAAAWEAAGQMLQRWSTHRGLAEGWFDGMKPLTAAEEFKPKSGETIGAWVDRICTFLLGATLPAERRAALVDFVGGSDSSPTTGQEWKASQIAALVLDSLYFQAR